MAVSLKALYKTLLQMSSGICPKKTSKKSPKGFFWSVEGSPQAAWVNLQAPGGGGFIGFWWHDLPRAGPRPGNVPAEAVSGDSHEDLEDQVAGRYGKLGVLPIKLRGLSF